MERAKTHPRGSYVLCRLYTCIFLIQGIGICTCMCIHLCCQSSDKRHDGGAQAIGRGDSAREACCTCLVGTSVQATCRDLFFFGSLALTDFLLDSGPSHTRGNTVRHICPSRNET